ncbi:hypothetical protein EWM64_g6309 [Hericium alpestre]|uniref:YTH domain-containing protein n=1 Tax=Hericium alpestre TaxID=135208 RepID=A0A4Y9ZUK5_9AGAM|nr:hypothetical protein EWM64_g6309 [Hericium alpestre]
MASMFELDVTPVANPSKDLPDNLYQSAPVSRQDSAIHDLESRLLPPFDKKSSAFPEHPSSVTTSPASSGYTSGDANGDNQDLSMSESSAPSSGGAAHTGSSRYNNHARRQTGRRPPRPTSSTRPSGSSPNSQDVRATPLAHPSTFQGPTPHYQSTPSFRQHNSFIGSQYTMSQQHPSMNMVHSPPFPYSHHPGGPNQEGSVPHIPYPSASMVPMMQSHTPVYHYQNHSPDGGSTSQHSFAPSAGPTPLPMYPHLSSPSPPPVSPLSPQQGHPGRPNGPAMSASYNGQSAYSPIGYSTPHQYAYAPPSFAHSPPLYQSQYAPPHYAQSYTGQGDQDGQGTWWYVPPGPGAPSGSYEGLQPSFQSPYNMGFPPVSRQEDGYGIAGPFTMSAQRSPAQGRGTQSNVPKDTQPSSPPSAPQSTSSPSALGADSADPFVASESRQAHVKRRTYHPNPPVQRSEWVMWAGNVPSDATYDELLHFFNQPRPLPRSPANPQSSAPQEPTIFGGVSSIFLISRSNCAFVNFESEQHLEAATTRYNGQPLRPNDPRCQRLVCRIRKPTDDLRSGVGGQRGMGMHTKWVNEQKGKARQAQAQRKGELEYSGSKSTASSPEEVAGRMGLITLSDDEGRRLRDRQSLSNSSESFTSSNSSMMGRYFPQRYFILKSLTQVDLDISVKEGLWATQRHNEGILDHAYRTSQDVYLIFGVNKSGEFYGYARMAGPISQGEHQIDWPPVSSPQRSANSQASVTSSLSPESSSAKRGQSAYFSPGEGRMAEASPAPVSSSREKPLVPAHAGSGVSSAPAEPHQPHEKLTIKTPQTGYSLDVMPHAPNRGFRLDSRGPINALRAKSEDLDTTADSRKGHPESLPGSTPLRPVQEVEFRDCPMPPPKADAENAHGRPAEDVTWGEAFPVQWIRTDRLPFNRTRQLRNPWNHGREVKVSRDGTELEPSIAKALLEEWERPPSSPQASPAAAAASPRPAGPQRRAARPIPLPP